MMRIQNAHQDREATVIKANRKHQIVLNMEVKRIEMEKKMRQRYFCFEMSLMKARRIKIVDRQKSLGIYRPRTMQSGKETRKGMHPTSFFFTQSVAMDSKVKLPPVIQKSMKYPGLPTKLGTGNSKVLQFSKNTYNNKIKEQAKRVHLARNMGTMEGSNGQSQTQSQMKKDLKKLDERQVDNQELESNNMKHKEMNSSNKFVNQDKIEKKLNGQNRLDKGDGLHEKKQKAEEKTERSEQNNSYSNSSSPVQGESNENHLTETSTQVAKPRNVSKKLAPGDQTCAGSTSTREQKITNFTTFQELQTWRNSLETCCFNSSDGYKALTCLTRLKSATGSRRDPEVYSVLVRPQTAFAKLKIM